MEAVQLDDLTVSQLERTASALEQIAKALALIEATLARLVTAADQLAERDI
jgi:hypothetical protein